MSDRTSSRWQSIAETVALVVVAAAVAWMAITRTAPGPAVAAAASARRPEVPLPAEPIALTGAELEGSQSAPVGLVVYSDFQCPYCGRFARETLPAIREQYVRTGKVLLAFRQFPLANHSLAQKAAEAAKCAGQQGRFWPFHDQLFSNQESLDAASLSGHAAAVGLEPRRFATCLNGEMVASVRTDSEGGQLLGVTGTPTFVAGPLLSDGRMKVRERFSGAQPLGEFQRVLDRLTGTSDTSAGTGQK